MSLMGCFVGLWPPRNDVRSLGFLTLFLFPILAFGNYTPTITIITDEQIDARMRETSHFFNAKRIEIEKRVNDYFNIDYHQLMKQYEAAAQELTHKTSLIQQIPDQEQKAQKLDELKKEYQDKDLHRYIEAYYFFQNEVEKDHLFMGELLARLEAILEMVLRKDALFRDTFLSDDFKQKNGLLLVRVVWPSQMLKDVSSETVPLNVHSVFGDKSKTPILVKVTPAAFNSLAFLRSVLVHELNHYYLFKDPKFTDIQKFEGHAMRVAQGPFSHYFSTLNPADPSYQYYLVHEFYSFKTQVLFDEKVPDTNYFKLDEANKTRVKNMLSWTYNQLNPVNKTFVEKNPDPPVLPMIEKSLLKRKQVILTKI